MKIVIVHGQSHKGSTYHIARQLAEKVSSLEDITEFFLPRDFSSQCVGCFQCIMDDEKKCPHYESLNVITQAMDEAELIILASPVYVYDVTGQMKTWLDHYGYRWMIHRPEESMFKKQAVVISTAAGGGMKSTNKTMKNSLFFWGVPKIYELGYAIRTSKWSGVTEERKAKIEKDTDKLSKKILKKAGHVRAGFKTKLLFTVMRKIEMIIKNPPDEKYWKEKGWDKKVRPWQRN